MSRASASDDTGRANGSGLEHHVRETYALTQDTYAVKAREPQGAMKQKLTVTVDAGLKMAEATGMTAGRVHSR